MDLNEYKIKRNERVKFLFNTGNTIGEISKKLAIDENLVRNILEIGPMQKRFNKYASKSLDVRKKVWQ